MIFLTEDIISDENTVEGKLKLLDGMKAVQLKAMCKEYNLKISGKKADLQERLKEFFLAEASKGVDDYDSMELKDIKDALVARCLPATGDREAMIKTLREDIQMTEEVKQNYDEKSGYNALCRVLDEAIKSGGPISEIFEEQSKKINAVPKYVDVKVTSLGLKPEKYTAAGAFSVTADVLRKLAGDPFADPPRYGTVSTMSQFVITKLT